MASSEHLVTRITGLLSLGHEARGFEAKGPGLAKGAFLAGVVRAALGLGNLRDGGLIVIGVDDKNLRSMGPGLTEDQARSWASYDDLADAFAAYADPPLQFHSELVTLGAGTANEVTVCAIEVDEFGEVPHICKRQFDAEKNDPNARKKDVPPLRRGAVYVRPRHKPETSEIASAEQMRELLDLAAQKALARYVDTAHRAGLTFTPATTELDHAAQVALFEAEREAGWE